MWRARRAARGSGAVVDAGALQRLTADDVAVAARRWVSLAMDIASSLGEALSPSSRDSGLAEAERTLQRVRQLAAVHHEPDEAWLLWEDPFDW